MTTLFIRLGFNESHSFSQILTPEGLTHTSEMIKCNMDNLKTYSKKQLKGKGRGTRSPHEIGKVLQK